MLNLKGIILSILITLLPICFNNSYAAKTPRDIKHIDDSVIVSRIYRAYLINKSPNPLRIKIKSKNGVVTLTGKVKNDKNYIAAIKIAKSIDGVSTVNAEQLNITKVEKLSKDLAITSNIETELVRNNIFDIKDIKFTTIDISTKNGIVSLTGTVCNLKKKNHIIETANKTPGVKHVDTSRLEIHADMT